MWVQIILSLHYDLLLELVTAMLVLVLVLVVPHTSSVEHPKLLLVIFIARKC